MSFNERPTAKTTVKANNLFSPTVCIDPNALDKMHTFVQECSDEIGWLGTVEEIESNVYHIKDVFLFEQDVHATTTEITPEGLSNFATELLEQPDGIEIWNNMKLWGHSHVNMGITPSGQDDKQMNTFSEGGHDWFMRLIANKKGELKIDIYNYVLGLEYHDVPWVRIPFQEEIEYKEQIAELQAKMDKLHKDNKEGIKQLIEPEMKEKVRKINAVTKYSNNQWYKQPKTDDHVKYKYGVPTDMFHTDFEVLKEFSEAELIEIAELHQGQTYSHLQELGYTDITHYDALRVHRVAKKETQTIKSYYTQQGGLWDYDNL